MWTLGDLEKFNTLAFSAAERPVLLLIKASECILLLIKDFSKRESCKLEILQFLIRDKFRISLCIISSVNVIKDLISNEHTWEKTFTSNPCHLLLENELVDVGHKIYFPLFCVASDLLQCWFPKSKMIL